jgi:hypothetical protein
VHQLTGGHNETYGGVTLNIDSDVTSSSLLTAVVPTRLYDSVTASAGTSPRSLKAAGQAGVPTNATGVAVTIKVVHPTTTGNLIVTPYGSTASVAGQQFAKDQTISTTMVVALHSGNIQFRLSAGRARIMITVAGYLTSASGSWFTAVAARALYDSRTAGVGTTPVRITAAGHGGVPASAIAVAVAVEVVHPTSAGNVLVAPYGRTTTIGQQQFAKDQTISTTVIVPLRAGAIQVRLSTGKARVIVSVLGYLSAAGGSALTAVGPNRLYDSLTPRIGTGWTTLHVAGRGGVPANATAVVLVVEVVHPTGAGNVFVAPYGVASSVGLQQFVKGQTISTTVIVPLRSGAVHFRVSAGKARVIVNVAAYLN